jgi:hypothetical protein
MMMHNTGNIKTDNHSSDDVYRPIQFGIQPRHAVVACFIFSFVLAICVYFLFNGVGYPITLAGFALNDQQTSMLYTFLTTIVGIITLWAYFLLYKSLTAKTYICFYKDGFTIPSLLFKSEKKINYSDVMNLHVGEYARIKYCTIITASGSLELTELGFEKNFMLLKLVHNIAQEMPTRKPLENSHK